tara:strand:+ start:1147 stop:2226 length:1080 start_codon:yes stop_codon:yes gene_type:complete
MAGQTDLMSDNFCGFNQAASPMFWILDPVQNIIQYPAGEVGTPAGVGLHTPGEVIDISSNIVAGGAQAGNVLTKCIPPAQPLQSKFGYETDSSIRNVGKVLRTTGFGDNYASPWPIGNTIEKIPEGNSVTKDMVNNFHYEIQENFENFENVKMQKLPYYNNKISNATGEVVLNTTDTSQFLIPQWNRNRRSAMDYSNVDWQAGFAGNGDNLLSDAQDLTYVIERMWLQRGGVDSNQMIKQAHESWMDNTFDNKANNTVKNPVICNKVKQPYNMKYPFGIPPNNISDENLPPKTKMGGLFNAIDVVSEGKSSPQLGQNVTNDIPMSFNYNSMYTNGGCNSISRIDNPKMCSNNVNDLTGI